MSGLKAGLLCPAPAFSPIVGWMQGGALCSGFVPLGLPLALPPPWRPPPQADFQNSISNQTGFEGLARQ